MLRVVEPGLLSSVQDVGRPAAVHLGVPVSGACDSWSMAVANRLLDNEPGAAVLEMTMLGATFEVLASGVIAIAGADMEAVVVEHGRPLAPGRSHVVERGATLRFAAARAGMRTYLALPGGIDVPAVLGSRSTCLAGGFGGLGGRAIGPGDVLRPARSPADATAGQAWPSIEGDPFAERVVRIVPVQHAPGVDRNAIAALFGQA
ncbi:MAG: biotin-dependent carboxyltransferase family protein, partial [Candidatus Limnocylindrales bacterium]